MEKVNLSIKGVRYEVDLDKLTPDKITLTSGRKFSLTGTDKKGKEETHKFTLNEIFDAVLTQHPKIHAHDLDRAYSDLRFKGYRTSDDLTTKAVFAFNQIFHNAAKMKMGGRVRAHQYGITEMLGNPSKLSFETLKAFGKAKGSPELEKVNREIIKEIVTNAIIADKKAETRDPNLNLELAKCYAEGVGVKLNTRKAIDICNKNNLDVRFQDLLKQILERKSNL